jgi:hypothetical protein
LWIANWYSRYGYMIYTFTLTQPKTFTWNHASVINFLKYSRASVKKNIYTLDKVSVNHSLLSNFYMTSIHVFLPTPLQTQSGECSFVWSLDLESNQMWWIILHVSKKLCYANRKTFATCQGIIILVSKGHFMSFF